MQIAAERIAPVPLGGEATGAAQAPPLALPGEHFAAAMAFFVLGSLGLVAIAPELAFGAFFGPRVIAAVHLFTVGWIMLSIFGALCQFLPVAIGRGLRWQRLAHVTFGLHVLGAAGFIIGLVEARHGLAVAGAASLSTAFVLFALNLGATLASVRDRSVTWWALAGATLFLVVTPLYGVLLQLNLIDGLGMHRFHVVAVHAHIAIIGVVLLVIVGVAHRLIPMFLLSHGATERPAWVAVALLGAGASLLALPMGGLALDAVGGILAAGGVIAFATQAVMFFRHRKRRALDPGLRLAAAGIVGLIAAMVIAPLAFTRGLADLRLLTTYFVVLLGALSLFVAGHYYKIVPFLVWYHRFGPLVGTRKVPKVSELFSERIATVDGLLLVAGLAGLAAGTHLGSMAITRAAAILFAIGVFVEVIVIAGIARRRPA
ncbi:MAG TPA: hypothetical protein VM513_35545 [Kofleriaceae bacterium]|jgi:hypothetical protein|nr:hypothetical protein [Kofleriaceae bacterium]